MIYVAGYFSANPMHGTANAVKAFDALIEAGWCPVVPHASIVLDMLSPRDPEFWYAYDLALLERCDAMYVCPDDVTQWSQGVAKEVVFCSKKDIPVIHEMMTPEEMYDR